MENLKFKIGDVVELNSGSPKMTVNQVDKKLSTIFYSNDAEISPEDIEVSVSWVDEKGELQKATFAEPLLKLYTES